MYASTTGINFRNPFDPTKSVHDWTPSHASYSQLNRPPTPPPEMQSAHRVEPVDSNSRYDESSYDVYRQPVSGVKRKHDDWSSPVRYESEPVVKKQASAIAPSFQIPKTVNDSGGSLSELAAQITCFFWFESSDLLDRIESSPIPVIPTASLAKDAIPTTGFRKWVTTILSTTLVGANVVLLALLFIHRLKKLNPSVRGKPGSEYRLLTVALMLGNKFLDDNTYTNKTWAEVSGINVSEVHIMEVEFLSNMKYCLYTSLEDWTEWQTLLGRFAAYFERAINPLPQRAVPAPILPPASALRIPIALPSPPASTQASPPYAVDGYPSNTPSGPTPAPSPLALAPVNNAGSSLRKRSLDDRSYEPVSKRIMHPTVPETYTPGSSFSSSASQRPTLPALPINEYPALPANLQQLPPLSVPARAMGLVYPAANPMPMHSMSGLKTQSVPQLLPQFSQSRQQSPYASTASPAVDMTPHTVHGAAEMSPSVFLQQRSSPYRPVHNVSTLLYPPPSAALQQRRPVVDHYQMHYQPLAKAAPLQSGQLPHIVPSWQDVQQPNAMVMHQWQQLPRHLTNPPL